MRPVDHARALFKYIDLTKPPVLLTPILDELGIELVYANFENFEGFSIVDGKFARIVVRKEQILSRQRFTIAHELGHIILGHHRDDESEKTSIHALERHGNDANAFAAELLMPYPLLELLWKRYESNAEMRVEVMAADLIVSREALRIKLRSCAFYKSHVPTR